MPDIAQRLEAVFKDVMRDETLPPTERTRTNCLTWDSLMHLGLALAIEEEFHISLSPIEVVDMNSFGVALDIINEKVDIPGK